jgi:L-ascorbate metabolism protein UlaG (beta-lactamase superfamily)
MFGRRVMLVFVVIHVVAALSWGQTGTVRITPLGSRTGDFCALDRALLFEDPTGVRILYDPGNTVQSGTDSRLGDVHAILLSHAHGDHIGSMKLLQDFNSPAALCAAGPGFGTPATPDSNAAQIAAAKNSAVIAGPPLTAFLALRIAQLRGAPTPSCPAAGLTNEFTVPRPEPCSGLLNPGGKRTIRIASASRGVQISPVPAVHPNELSPDFLTDPEKTDLSSNNISAYAGLANGFVVTFTNGLKVYLSGDTGLTGDMETVVHQFYRASLAVINISDIFVTGPEEAAHAVRNLIKATAVIPSHVNEIATTGGVVNAGTRTARFIELLRQTDNGKKDDKKNDKKHDDDDDHDGRSIPVHVPRSGITMEFDGQGRCRTGCN